MTISNLFGIFPAQLTRNALDLVAAHIETYKLTSGFSAGELIYEQLISTIFIFGVLVLAMAVLKGIFMFLMRQTIIVMSRHIEFDLKNEIFNQYQKLGMDFYNRNSTGDLMNRISEDVGRVRMYVGPAVMYSINMLVMFVLVIWAMFSVNTRLALFVLLPLPLLSALIYFVHERINRKSEEVQRELSGLSTFVQEAFSGIRLLKSYGAESRYISDYAGLTQRYSKASMGLVKVNAVFMPAMAWLVGLSTILTILIGGMEVLNGRVSIGNIAEFVIYVNMLTWPVAALGWVISIVQRASASQERISDFLNEKPGIVSGGIPLSKINGDIILKDVSVRYAEGRDEALRGIELHIRPGSKLGVIGKTGSGKTTLVHLLMRQLDPDSGSLSIDGQDLKELQLDQYRSRIACVPQDVFLFSDTIEANIAFGSTNNVNSDDIRRVASQAEILDAIEAFPDGFQTRVGERGITLSGGQKQRVSIARAILRNPDVLIFDDCLSAVDTWTESRILKNLLEIMKGKTSVFISHRVHTVQSCDHIIVLDQGRIAEQGSHEELIAMNGLYSQLMLTQLRDEPDGLENGPGLM